MLEIEIYLNAHGQGNCTQIGRINIINVGGEAGRADYNAEIFNFSPGDFRRVLVRGFNRKRGFLMLLKEVMKKYKG